MKAGYFSEDVETFLQLLYKYNVRYVIAGYEAVIYYGYPRLTGDIDIFYGISQGNIEQLYKALLDFWDNNIPGIADKSELEIPNRVIQFGVPPNRIDIMNAIDGIEFDIAWEEKKTEMVPVKNEWVTIYLISLKHLIENKSASARNKDLDDLTYLRNVNSH